VRFLKQLFKNNEQWAEQMLAADPQFFERLAAQQAPQFLWIGCSDSRVPANEIVGLLPGEVFVHRNVANVVAQSDLNALSVIQFAVDALKVQHVMVVGHSNCGGVRAAVYNLRVGLVDNWLSHVRDVRDRHQAFLSRLPMERQVEALCELNVLEQVRHVCDTTFVQDAWTRGQPVVIHGWVYGLHNGIINDLNITATCAPEVMPAYEKALAAVKSRYLAELGTGVTG